MTLSALVRDLEAHQARTLEPGRAWDPRQILFPSQLAVFDDRTSSRTLVDCSRRAGKSFLAAALLIDLSLRQDNHNALYLTQSSEDTREILWRQIVAFNEEYQLGGRTNEQRLEITWPNGSFVRLAGCKDHNEARRRIKGRRWHFVWIDEGQNFPDYLEEMVEAGLIPTLMGKGGLGRIMMSGTPGPVPGVGYYEEAVLGSTWTVYHWTIRENLALDQAEVESYLAGRAQTLGATSAIHLREDLGERPPPDDSTGLVYVYNRLLNDPDQRGYPATMLVLDHGARWQYPALGGTWHTGIGMDLGHARDVTAMAVVGVNDAVPGVAFLLEEYIAPRRLLVPGIAAKLLELITRWHPSGVACDEGGLGVALADQLRAPPYALPVTAADKLHPLASSDALNTGLTTGRLLLSPRSRAAADMSRVRWDLEARRKGRRKEALQPHSDVLPACRYIWPHVVSLLEGVRSPVPRPQSLEELEAAEVKKLRSRRPGQREGWKRY